MSLPKSKLMLISIICIASLAVAALLILEDKPIVVSTCVYSGVSARLMLILLSSSMMCSDTVPSPTG